MPRETLRKLSEDVERVLVAGAHLAAGDAGLERDKAALDKLIAQLGAKAPPVLGKLAAATEQARSAKPKEQARELLGLATMTAQVRAAQTQLATEPDDQPLTAVAEIGTPCNAKDLYQLHDALVTKGPGRLEKVDAALERGDIGDLRLVHAVVYALGDAYGELADKVAGSAMPAFGRAIIGPVRANLKFPGRSVDGRRLTALVAVEREGSLPLVEQALREGSADMREAALEALETHLNGVPSFEPLVLGLLESERSGAVRRAAIGALSGYSSDASLTLLLRELDKHIESSKATDGRLRETVAGALRGSKHPDVVPQLLSRLADAVAAAAVKVKKGDKEAEARRERARAHAVSILGALAGHESQAIVAASRELLDSYGPAAARAMLRSAGPKEIALIADQLDGDDANSFPIAVEAILRLSPKEQLARLSKPLLAKDRGTKLGEARQSAITRWRFVPEGKAWTKVLIDAVKMKPLSSHAIYLLGMTRDADATPVLLELLASENERHGIVQALGTLGDPRAFEPLLAMLSKNTQRYMWHVQYALEALAREQDVDRVRTEVAKASAGKGYNYMDYLLRRLERKFPGA